MGLNLLKNEVDALYAALEAMEFEYIIPIMLRGQACFVKQKTLQPK